MGQGGETSSPEELRLNRCERRCVRLDLGHVSGPVAGAGFVPKNLDLKIVDKVLSISNNSAFSYARMLARLEGIAGGISSGAVLAAAIEMNEDKSMTGKNTVIILPSFAERYLSTPLFSEMSDEKN